MLMAFWLSNKLLIDTICTKNGKNTMNDYVHFCAARKLKCFVGLLKISRIFCRDHEF